MGCVGVWTISEYGRRKEADEESDLEKTEYKAFMGGQHISEAVHFESQIPENLSRYNMQHCLLTSAIDQAGHSSCQTATRAHIDLLFCKVHVNMPVSCHIPNPETVI